VALQLHEGAGLAIGPQKTGGIQDPALHEFLQASLGVMVENGRAPEGMQVAIGVEAQLRRAVVPMGQLLAGIAKRLEVANGVGMLQSGHEQSWPGHHFDALARELCGSAYPKNRTLNGRGGYGKVTKSVKVMAANGLI